MDYYPARFYFAEVPSFDGKPQDCFILKSPGHARILKTFNTEKTFTGYLLKMKSKGSFWDN